MHPDGAGRRRNEPTFADLLALFRANQGLSQERLAEVTGISVRAVSDLERGATKRPRRKTVFALANGLGLDAAARDHLLRAARARSPVEQPRPAAGEHAGGLIGRDRELAGLVELLHRSTVRMVSVLGPAGVGKSALATAALERLEPDVEVVRLDSSVERPDPAALIGSMPRPRRARLLVIDGSELERIDPETLAALLYREPSLRLLVTGREPVRLRAEHRWPIDALKEPAATRLLVRRAREIRPGFVLTDEDEARLVVRRLRGNPMAIGLAAVRLRTQTLSEVDAALAVELAGVTDGVLHRIIRTTVDRLPPVDAQRLKVLASLRRASPDQLRRTLAAQRTHTDHLDATIALLAANALITVTGAQVQLAVPRSVREAVLSEPQSSPGTLERFRAVSTIVERAPVWNSPSS